MRLINHYTYATLEDILPTVSKDIHHFVNIIFLFVSKGRQKTPNLYALKTQRSRKRNKMVGN